jgi:hypothetical protein
MIDRMRNHFAPRAAVFAALLLLATSLGAQTQATSGAEPQSAQSPEQAQPTPSQEWKAYSYPADGFSASFPSEPQMSKRDVPTDKGSFELRAYMGQDGQAAIYVGVCDYGSAIADRTPDTVLDGAQEGAIDNVKGHLTRGKRITFGIYPGRELEAENDTMHFYARIYLVGTTLYQTLAAAPLGQPYANATRFLDSFQLIAHVSGAATP